ncbi:MAG: winged helix DNA-binding domain-containing protein [Bacteroidota bacterium]
MTLLFWQMFDFQVSKLFFGQGKSIIFFDQLFNFGKVGEPNAEILPIYYFYLMQILSKNTAHQFILHSQGLAPGQSRSGKSGVLQTIRDLGYVQIDTISVVERAHHHVLWTRVPDYEPAQLRALDEEDRAVFDYWAHAASYLPMEYYPYSLYSKSRIDEGSGFWRITDPTLEKYVLDRIGKEGPLMSKDFKKEKNRSDLPWRLPAINMVIRQLFMRGELMVAGRRGMQKCYDLTDRVLPAGVSTKIPTVGEYAEHIVRRDLRAHGLVKLSEMGHLLRVKRKEYQIVLQKMMDAGDVLEVEIKGINDGPYFAFKDQLDAFSPFKKKTFHILSPFDNLIIQRRRLAEIFDFDYTLECYVTAAKRKFGYFGLPLLYGHQFVGLLDAKADRKTKTLHIKKLEWTGKTSQTLLRAFDKKLKAFARFCGCDEVFNEE